MYMYAMYASSSAQSLAMLPSAAEGALLELRAFVERKRQVFTPPSVPAGWATQQGRKLCVMGNFETAGLNLNGDLRAER